MAESIDRYFEEFLNVKYSSPNEYSPLALAYIGDSVFDLMVKTCVVLKHNMQAHKYHVEVSHMVKASSQADYIDMLLDAGFLTEEEEMVYKRGRNTKTHSTAKNASVGQYRKATGFETLIGYLYLKKDYDRLFLIMQEIRKNTEREDDGRE